EIVRAPQHPYTRGLLEANVRPGQVDRPEAITGSPPNLANLPPGCSFAPRCAVAADACWDSLPELVEVSPGHSVRCTPVTAALASGLLAAAPSTDADN
ncbi:MAG: oligopeptide/dipeptide ABC transporter ATP-binding protein, partial [Dehalococcoidia bacterium]